VRTRSAGEKSNDDVGALAGLFSGDDVLQGLK
jgi:hypothetical protein